MRRFTWQEINQHYVGNTYRRRIGGAQQTLKVIDCTLGGDVVVKAFRMPDETMKQEKWIQWVCLAKKVKP